jgi:flagellar motor protein MotB
MGHSGGSGSVPTAETGTTPDPPVSDVFESDPFFNPRAASSTPGTPLSTATFSHETPSAEERLLRSIVGETAAAAPSPAPEAGPLSGPGSGDALALEHALEELARAKARCQALETEAATALERATREAAQRRDEAVRYAAAEQDWARKAEEFKRQAQRADLYRDFEPRRPSSMLFTGVVIAGLVLAGGAFLAGRIHGSRTRVTEAAPEPAPDVTATPAPQAPTPTPQPPPAQPEPELAPVPTPPAPAPALESAPTWPALTGSGFTTRRQDDEMTVVFNYGVFAKGAELSDTARHDLTRISVALKPVIARFRIEVEGHTDAAPVAAGRAYASNRELGLARAKAVADYLAYQCGLPATSITTTSLGESNPPHPNTTPENRRKNRTVVLRLRSL